MLQLPSQPTNPLAHLNLNLVKAELCRRSFYRFVQEFWSVIIHEVPVWNWHIEYLCGELQQIAERVKRREPTEYEYYIINIPPGSSKSTIVSQMYIAWTWTIDPTQRFICASYSKEIARKDASFTQLILNSDKYKAYFPTINLNKDAVDLIKNNHGGERFATSVGGSVTGIHAHQILPDDPLNPQQSTSKVERDTANEWFTTTLSNRKIDQKITPTILTMQRLHEDDCAGYLMARGVSFKLICLPAECDTNVRPLHLAANYVNGLFDPIRLSQDTLNQKKVTLGSYGYAGQMLQKPSPTEGGMFKRDWFKICERSSVPKVAPCFVVDTAYTSNERNDPTGMMSYVIAHNSIYITKFKKGHWEFGDQCKNLVDFTKDNGYTMQSIVEAEPKATGKSVVQTLKAQTSLNIKEGKNPTKDKEARANDIAPYIESGRVYLVRDGWNDDFIEQCCTFPNAKNDEEVDCLIMACQRAFKKSKSIRT